MSPEVLSQINELNSKIVQLSQEIIKLNKNILKESVVIMVDRTNLEQSWKRVSNSTRTDYLSLAQVLTGDRRLKQSRIYYSDLYYDQLDNEQEKFDWQRRQDFYLFLRHNGWVLRSAHKKIHEGIVVEKGLDTAMVLDIEKIGSGNRCDTIVLVAGDADYSDVVQKVIVDYCIKVEVVFFRQQTARSLINSASKFINMEDLVDRISR